MNSDTLFLCFCSSSGLRGQALLSLTGSALILSALLQVDQLVFKQLVDGQFPRLTSHLDSLGVNVASVSTQWFLCIFVNSLPLETCLRVWDIFLFEKSSSVLFRVALALVDIYAQVPLHFSQ